MIESPQEESVFSIRLTETGKRLISRTLKISLPVILLAVVINVANILITIYYLIEYYEYSRSFLFTSVLQILVDIAIILNNIYFLRFISRLKKSTDINDESGFNRSFRTLFISSVVWMIGVILTLLLTVITTIQILKLPL